MDGIRLLETGQLLSEEVSFIRRKYLRICYFASVTGVTSVTDLSFTEIGKKKSIDIPLLSFFFLEKSLHVCVPTSVTFLTNFKPDSISFPAHITMFSRLSQWLTILIQQ